MKFILNVKTNHYVQQPYIYDNLTGELTGEYFKEFKPPEHLFFRKPYSIIEIVLGYNCNGTCGYCDQTSLRNIDNTQYDEIYLERFCKQVTELVKRDIQLDQILFGFWGGDGLLYFKYIPYMWKYFKKQFPNSVIWSCIPTNGRLLKGDIAKWCIDNEIFMKVSHEGRFTKQLRNYDPFEDDEVLKNLEILHKNHRLSIAPTVHKFTVSEWDTIQDIRKTISGDDYEFGDMKFIYPVSDKAYNDYAYPKNKLSNFLQNKVQDLFQNESFCQTSIITDVQRHIYKNIRHEFILEYHRNEDCKNQLKIHLDGRFTWAHSQHPTQRFPSGESCSYGSLWNMDKKPIIPPRYVYNMFETKCQNCPILAFGDRGCVCMVQYGEKYQDYYCETQRARILPVFIKEFYNWTEAMITNIVPLNE